ncbi:hypothetical protein QJQ45_016556, partial [Haematococcus lacustris]
ADEAAVQEVKQQLQQAFDVHDLGQAADFLGMRIAFDRAAGILRLTQQQYIEQLLQRFGLAECNPRQLPLSPGTQLVKEGEQLSEQHTLRYRELVGGLLWLSTCTRPDIAFAVGQLTRYMQAPTREHEQAAQGVLRYLRGTARQGLVFRGSCSGELVGFCDSDYASCKQSRRSTTGYVFILSGATVSVRSKLQTTVATSTTEAEYQAAADATREALFLRKLLHELCAVSGPVPILCDSQGAVALVKNPVESQRSKHIAVMHHMARERGWRGEVEFSYCPTADMVADALTKALPGPKFVSLWAHVTSVCNSDIEKCSPFESAALRRVSGEPVPMMAVAVREKLGQPGVQFENWEFEMKALLRQHGLGAVVKAPVGLEGNSRLGSVSAAAASPARPVGVATPAISPAAAVAAAATAAVAASLTPEQDEKAHAIICSSVDPNKYRALCNRHESARALWQALRNMHTQQVHASRQQLIIKAGRQSMQSGQSVQEYWAEAQDLHERINSTGAYSDTLCQALLGLPPDYQQLVQSILEQPLDEQLTFEQILPRLLLREQLLQNSQPHAVALAARSAGGGGRPGSRGQGDGSHGRGRGQARGGRGFQGECWQCHQRGHQAHQCPNRPVSPVPRSPSPSWRGAPSSRSNGAGRPPTPGPGGGTASGWGSSARGRDSSSPNRHPGSMSRSNIAYSVVSKPLLFGEWVIDSGCSRHLTPHRELLHDYQPLHEPHHIIVANGGRIEAQGQGVVCFEGAGGAMQLLDVLHVPEADGSLVSVGKATRAGGSVHFTPFGCSINMPGAKHSIRGTQVEQDLFLLDSKPVPVAGGFSLAARTCSDPLVLHHRLGHPGYRQLARMLREGMVRGTSVTAAQCEAAASELCEPCVMGKQTSLEARQHAGLGVTATRPLMLVHSDVCDVTGQYSAATPDGMRYFVSLLDEFSGLVAVVLIKHKSDAPAALRDMVTLLQRRLGHKVVYLRTDRGGEYIGAETQQWLRSEGITHQQTAPRTPTMNGSAERVNRTIMECVRAMMLASGVPAYFWGFGVMAAAHVHNLRPVAGKPCTPHEACFGSHPDIHHLRVWGCPAWVHDSEPSSKLASRGIKGVFVGYEEGGKAYQVWAEGRLYVSKSVVFDEQAVLRRFAPVSANRGGGSSDSNSGGGGQAGSRGEPPAAPDSSGGDGVGAGGAGGLGSSGGMESGTPDTVPALRPALVPPERRRSERVRKRVDFPHFVTLCYSARYESNSSSGSEREGDGSRGSRGSSGGAVSQPAEPRSFSEAMSRPDAEEWGRAMDADMASQHANQTWVLVSRQPGMSVLPGRWVLKVKWGSDGSIVKYKARWVVKGFRQRDGVDYFEDAVFAPVKGWGLWQIDFKTAFFNSKLTDADPQIFVEQPEGYEVGKGLVCQLQRTVYGLKQAPRAWYMCLREQLELIGFRASAADPSLFSLCTSSGSAVHMLVYVDDCILASADEAAVQEVKQQLQQAFDVHDLGQAADFLGMRIAFDRAAGILRLTQQQYIEQLLQRFGLAECNPRQLPLSPGTQLVKEGEQLSEQHTLRYRELVGGLLWLSTCTRPDIAFAVGQLTRYMQAPTREHEQAAQGVLRYLRGTARQGLVFRGSCSGELVGFCDSDYASCKQSRRSTTGYVFILSGATVSVRSKLQTTVATSTTEAEYQAAADATREALFLRKLLHELCAVSGPVPILCDSQGAVALVKNPVESQRSKHIAVMHHMARERGWRGEVEFSYCPTADMVADALTKALPGPKFVSCKAGMGGPGDPVQGPGDPVQGPGDHFTGRLASADEAAVQEVKQQLQQAFDVHDLGQAADFLGMRIAFDRAAGILRLTQQQYIEQLLQRFGLAECNPRQLPLSPGTQLVKEGEQLSEQHTLRYRELVGGLLWLSTCTRPDIAFAVGQLTRYMQAPTREHEQAAQGVLRYLRGTARQGLVFRGSCSGELVGFCDSDYASCKQSRRSTTGYVFILSGATVSVRSKLQTTVATSTTEAEYQAAADATREALFLRKLLHELCAVSGPVPILCDSQGAVALVKNPVESQRSKHIAVMHHMARERGWRGEVEFSYCPTADMVADALTKALPGPKFVSCKAGMGVG